MDLSAWLQYLETFPSGLKNHSIVNVKAVAKRLGLCNFCKKVIIVGGTNGKSSSVIFLEAILHAAGYKTGAYISPHILRFNERIRVNGKDIDDQTLCQTFTQVNMVRAGTILSYFEFSTLAALAIFKKQKPDVLILEVGLGGRFDAVNILNADIAIITTISLDHTNILGNTQEAIGREKAGIIRALKPIICGNADVPKSIYMVAKKAKATLYAVNRDFSYSIQNGKWSWQFSSQTMKNLPLPRLPIADAATVLMAIKLLQKDLKISRNAIITGLKNAFLPGRWQRITIANKEVIFDVAHNPESAALLAKNLIEHQSQGRILAVMSMLNDKDITATLQKLTKIVNKWYISTVVGVRATSMKRLQQCLLRAGGSNFVSLPDISAALHLAIAECNKKDKIVVFGSFHTVAECFYLL